MSHLVCLLITSGALNCIGDIYVVLVESSDKLEGSSAMYSLFISILIIDYSLLDSIENEIKLVVTVNKFRCSTSGL